MEWLWIPAGIIIFVLINLFIGGFIVFIKACERKPDYPSDFDSQFAEYKLQGQLGKRMREDFEWINSHHTDELCIRSEDGLRLHASLIEAPSDMTPMGVIILVHGFRSNFRRDFCLHIPLLHKLGYHIIAIDQRAHERSEGKYVCYGTRESSDVMRWREKAAELYGKDMPVVFFGLSMGGATVLMASGRVPKEDTGVRCIIADCPLSSPERIITHVMKNYNHNPIPAPFMLFSNFWSRWLAGFSISSKGTEEIFATSHLHALLFHGDADDFVPPWNSQCVIDAAPERAKLIMVKGARHAEAIYYDEKGYMEAVVKFLNEHV